MIGFELSSHRVGRAALTLLLALFVTVFGSGYASAADDVLTVGATPVPHAEVLLRVVKPLLAEQGIELDVIEFSDYIQPNLALADEELDANYFQHIPYLRSFSEDHNLDLTYTAKVHIEPMGLYSKKIDSPDELPDGALIGIPNDPTNGGRALLLLQSAGLITLRQDAGLEATEFDIVENPKNIKVIPLQAAYLPRSLGDVTASVINGNYALEAGLSPTEDSLLIEGADSPYVNVLAIRSGEADRPELQALADALTSPEVKEFIIEEYGGGAVVPVF